jgi:hypothetical protein
VFSAACNSLNTAPIGTRSMRAAGASPPTS